MDYECPQGGRRTTRLTERVHSWRRRARLRLAKRWFTVGEQVLVCRQRARAGRAGLQLASRKSEEATQTTKGGVLRRRGRVCGKICRSCCFVGNWRANENRRCVGLRNA
eukprot:1526551-Lingulodinium_polyedra.AAC.1